jgi:hypothetical protein
VQLEIDGQLGWPYQADVVAHDRDPAAVSLLAQALEDLLRAIGVRIEQPCDVRLGGRGRSKRDRASHLATVSR